MNDEMTSKEFIRLIEASGYSCTAMGTVSSVVAVEQMLTRADSIEFTVDFLITLAKEKIDGDAVDGGCLEDALILAGRVLKKGKLSGIRTMLLYFEDMLWPDAELERGPRTDCGACGGSGCDRCCDPSEFADAESQ